VLSAGSNAAAANNIRKVMPVSPTSGAQGAIQPSVWLYPSDNQGKPVNSQERRFSLDYQESFRLLELQILMNFQPLHPSYFLWRKDFFLRWGLHLGQSPTSGEHGHILSRKRRLRVFIFIIYWCLKSLLFSKLFGAWRTSATWRNLHVGRNIVHIQSNSKNT
jgi:hypothetical protein